jgi:hypothetical protein
MTPNSRPNLRSRRARLGDYTDEGFIGLVGPFWMRMEGDAPNSPS